MQQQEVSLASAPWVPVASCPLQLGQPQMPTHGQAPLRAVVEPTALGHLLTTTVCVFTTRTSPHLSPFVEKEMATHSSILA